MARWLLALVLAAVCFGQAANPLAQILNFEGEHAGGKPAGWGAPAGVSVDDKIVHGGKWAARIERKADNAQPIVGITKSMPMEFGGSSIELRAFLRTEGVTDFVGLWMREDGDGGSVAFDNMQRRQLKGTTDWQEYSIKLPVNAEGRQLFFGVFVSGTGTAWVDDVQLLVDGKPIWEAPKAERPKTAVDTDQEFDAGSRIVLNGLTNVQTENLTTLGKVWGFLKYHHPAITSGKLHWDYELFRVMPAILAAPDRTAANRELVKWANGVGELAACKPCASLKEDDLHLRPGLAWIDDKATLGAELSALLRKIHTNRSAPASQFYVKKVQGIGNPSFEHEPTYQRVKFPDAGYQILALYRLWNIIEYWFPYRDVIGESWDGVLRQSISKIGLAKDSEAFQRELMAVIARIHDTHANLWSSMAVRPPTGTCQLAVNVRFLENRAVVTGYSGAEEGKATGLKPGDVITELDGVPVAKLVESWSPYYAASNEPTRLRDIARGMTRGACGETAVRVHRGSEEVELKATRVTPKGLTAANTHDKPGDTFQRLSEDVAYIKLSSIKGADVARYLDSAAGTKGLIIDIRNYPSEFVVFTLGQLLVDKPTDFVTFTSGDLSNPGAFHWGTTIGLSPQKPYYSGKVVILVDEVSQSQAEYTTMAFRTARGAKVIGSTTAGADGNVSTIPLPGGFRSMISGIGVFYPDKRPTQRVGIVADIEVKPTIEGIRAGRDEVLEAAIAEIVKK